MALVSGIFILTLAVIVGAYWVFVDRPDASAERALLRRLSPDAPNVHPVLITAEQRLSRFRWLDRVLAHFDRLVTPLQRTIDRADLSVTPGAVVLGCIFVALAVSTAVNYLTTVPFAGTVAGIAAAPLPLWYVGHRAHRRLAKFEEQFPSAIDLISRALRAGHALSTALEMVAEETNEPVKGEFRRLFERQNFGMSLEQALRGFADRMPLVDTRFFVTAILTQREVGGNLSEILDNLSAVIRERFSVKREIRVASAHGRITGWVLGLLPPVIAGMLFAISPTQMRLLAEDPAGMQMVIAAIALQITGIVLIRRIINVEY
jgi:tight adherence protein B